MVSGRYCGLPVPVVVRYFSERATIALHSVPFLRCGRWGCAQRVADRLAAGSFATDVYGGAALAIRVGLPQKLVGNRGGVSFPEEKVAEQVREGVALRPTEVAVWLFAGSVTHVEQDGGDGVRDGRAFGAQHLVAVDLDAPHLEYLLELRRIANVDL